MSADNWTTCPRCDANREALRAKKWKKLEDSYGRVPASEYIATRQALEVQRDTVQNTWREGYFVGVREGEFRVAYEGGCTECGLTYEHDFKVRVPWKGSTP